MERNKYSTKLIKVRALAARLMPDLLYHNINHAIEVYEAVSKLAVLEKVSEENKFLLQTAALLHDILYEPNNAKNEERSADVARSYLLQFNCTFEQANKIASLILSTKLPRNPSCLLEKIICDADLYYLGKEDAIEKGNEYGKELGMHINKDWYSKQLAFFQAHVYYTESARKLRNSGKAANIQILEKMLQELKC